MIMTLYKLSPEREQLAKPWQQTSKTPLFMHYADEKKMYNCVMLVSARFFRVSAGLKGSYNPNVVSSAVPLLDANKTKKKA